MTDKGRDNQFIQLLQVIYTASFCIKRSVYCFSEMLHVIYCPICILPSSTRRHKRDRFLIWNQFFFWVTYANNKNHRQLWRCRQILSMASEEASIWGKTQPDSRGERMWSVICSRRKKKKNKQSRGPNSSEERKNKMQVPSFLWNWSTFF